MCDPAIQDSYIKFNHEANARERQTTATFDTVYAEPEQFVDEKGRVCYGDKSAWQKIQALLAKKAEETKDKISEIVSKIKQTHTEKKETVVPSQKEDNELEM